jgi:anti-anti-sigma regulatory factor
MLAGSTDFRVEDFDSAGRHKWVLLGRLDRDSVPAFQASIVQLCCDGARAVDLDLGHLKALDPAGVRAISLAREVCDRHGCAFALTPLSRAFNVPSRRLGAHRRAVARAPSSSTSAVRS